MGATKKKTTVPQALAAGTRIASDDVLDIMRTAKKVTHAQANGLLRLTVWPTEEPDRVVFREEATQLLKARGITGPSKLIAPYHRAIKQQEADEAIAIKQNAAAEAAATKRAEREAEKAAAEAARAAKQAEKKAAAVEGAGTKARQATAELPTDLGVALRMVKEHGYDLLACGKDWYVWDGRRFRHDTTGAVDRRMKQTVLKWLLDAAHIEDDNKRKENQLNAIKYQDTPRIKAAIELARTESKIAARSDELDASGTKLNLLNGTLDLRIRHDEHEGLSPFELTPHSRLDRITLLAPVEYIPDMHWTSLDDGTWKSFLDTVFPDYEMQEFVQVATGYSLLGGNPEEHLFYMLGAERAGKSTFITAIKATFGDYFGTADFGMFTKSQFHADASSARPELVKLRGKRIISAIETEHDRTLATGALKMYTGGDALTGRALYKGQEEWNNTWTPWLVSNDAPKIDDNDDAFWSRIIRIKFDRTIPEAERRAWVKESLSDPRQNGSAILAWSLDGLWKYREMGLVIPEKMRADTRNLRADMNPLAVFIDEKCVLGDDQWAATGVLLQAYRDWCRFTNTRPVIESERSMGKRLSRVAGLVKQPDPANAAVKGWRGIGIRPYMGGV